MSPEIPSDEHPWPLHNPWDSECNRNSKYGFPLNEGSRCPVCRPLVLEP